MTIWWFTCWLRSGRTNNTSYSQGKVNINYFQSSFLRKFYCLHQDLNISNRVHSLFDFYISNSMRELATYSDMQIQLAVTLSADLWSTPCVASSFSDTTSPTKGGRRGTRRKISGKVLNEEVRTDCRGEEGKVSMYVAPGNWWIFHKMLAVICLYICVHHMCISKWQHSVRKACRHAYDKSDTHIHV